MTTTHLTGCIQPPEHTLDADIAAALRADSRCRDDLASYICRSISPVPEDGERSIRDSFYRQWNSEHPSSAGVSRCPERRAAWLNSSLRRAQSTLRLRLTWNAEILCSPERYVEMANVESVLDDLVKDKDYHWSSWIDNSDSETHALSILTMSTVGCAVDRHAALVGMDNHIWRTLSPDTRTDLLIAAWCQDKANAEQARRILHLTGDDNEHADVDTDDALNERAQRLVDAQMVRSKRSLDRQSLHLLLTALDDPRSVDDMDDDEVLTTLRNPDLPRDFTEQERRALLASCGLSLSRTNPTWLDEHTRRVDGRWMYKDQEITYTTARGSHLCDGTSVALAADRGDIFDWMAYNDVSRISAGPHKSSPKFDVEPSRLLNDCGRLAQRYDVATSSFTSEMVEENLESVRTNPGSGFTRNIVFDIDHADALDRINAEDVPPPTYIVESVDNGHAHAVYVLREPFWESHKWTLLDALRARLSIVLGADDQFTNGYTKNPFSPSFRTHWSAPHNIYDIDTLFHQSCEALDAHTEQDLGLRLWSTDKMSTQRIKTLCGVERRPSPSRRIGAPSTSHESRHQRTFDLVRTYAYSSWREYDADWSALRADTKKLRAWSAAVIEYAVRSGIEVRESSSSTTAFDVDEMRQIADSVVRWMLRKYRPSYGGAATRDSQRAAEMSARCAFTRFADDLVNAFSRYARRGHKTLVINTDARTIELPAGVSVAEARRIYARAFPGERISTQRVRRHLLSSADSRTFTYRRTMRDLDVAERSRIISYAMATAQRTSWSVIEKRFALADGVLGRLVHAYKHQPQRVVGDVGLSAEQAQRRWTNSIRQNGSLSRSHAISDAQARSESLDAHRSAEKTYVAVLDDVDGATWCVTSDDGVTAPLWCAFLIPHTNTCGDQSVFFR